MNRREGLIKKMIRFWLNVLSEGEIGFYKAERIILTVKKLQLRLKAKKRDTETTS